MSDIINSTQEQPGKLPQQKNNKKVKHKRNVKKILIILGILTLIIMITAGITVLMIIREAPELDPDKLILAQSPQIFDNNEELMTTLLSAVNRRSADIDDMPQVLKDAVVCLEDVRFYDHFG